MIAKHTITEMIVVITAPSKLYNGIKFEIFIATLF